MAYFLLHDSGEFVIYLAQFVMDGNSQELPGTQWLGYGVNMITLSPINIDVVRTSSVYIETNCP